MLAEGPRQFGKTDKVLYRLWACSSFLLRKAGNVAAVHGAIHLAAFVFGEKTTQVSKCVEFGRLRQVNLSKYDQSELHALSGARRVQEKK
jgi:hypothetical protein